MQPINFSDRASDRELVDAAIEARGRAYAPCARFPLVPRFAPRAVVSIQAATWRTLASASPCAERVALFAALAAGKGPSSASRSWQPPRPSRPAASAGRQGLMEFAPQLLIVTSNLAGSAQSTTLMELLPVPFCLQRDI